MKKLFILSICVLLTLSMILSSCDFAAMFDGEESETVTTTETPTTENTTPIENPPEETPVETDEELYNNALTLLDEGKIEDAYAIFLTIQDYADVSEYLSRFSYKYTTQIVVHNYPNKSEVGVVVAFYDQYGKPLEELYCHPDKSRDDRFSYQYDENQNLVKYTSNDEYGEHSTVYGYDEENRPIWRLSDEGLSTVEYDDASNVIKRVSEYTGTTVEYEYDFNNNVIKTTYSYDGKTTLIIYNEYNEKGELIKTTQDFCPGQTVTTYTYDENGNLLVRDKVQDNGLNSRDEHEYDQYGNCTKSTYHSAWDDTYTCYYREYDEQGNITKETHTHADGSIDYVYRYTYDQKGNCIKKIYEKDGEVYETLQEYDANGNLLRVATESYVIEYSGWRLYYNPYPVMIDGLNQFIGK